MKDNSMKDIQLIVDALAEKYQDKLIFSATLAILGDDFAPQQVEILQFGIRDALCLMLKESLSLTEQCEEDFIQSNPRIIH